MQILILGMGHIGKALAERLRSGGHGVVGTTTTKAKVESLARHADRVCVVRGSDRAAVSAAAMGCDAVVVTVAPNVRDTRTKEEREARYREVLLASCESVAQTTVRPVFLSSFSVYGDGGEGAGPVTEATPVANQQEPSARYYHLAENAILAAGGCALRFPDMYGAPGDLSFPQRVKLAHEYFGGKTIFGANALLYAIHFEDVVSAVAHVLDENLTGVYNVCDDDNIPATNQQAFDAICDDQGLDRLEFLDQIKAPRRKISAAKLYATGFKVTHPVPFPA